MRQVYLDHNATTPIRPEVREAMLPFLGEKFGNPSSAHWAGRGIAGHIEEAREHAARLIGASPKEVYFTSGGSEGDNMAIKGVVMRYGKGCHVVTSSIEHPAVYSTCKLLEPFGFEATYVAPNAEGMVEPEKVREAMRDNTVLVSVMLANNETGVINPLKEISAIARERGAVMHTDAVQGVGKIPINVDELGVDILTASGHKFNAPKGVGFQYIREGVEVLPIISGGGQERGLRAGTENVAGIAALGRSCELAHLEQDERMRTIGALRDRLEKGILAAVPETRVNGSGAPRVYNTANISFKYIEGDALMDMLDSQGVAVSTGSACSSESSEPSRILVQQGLDVLCSRGALRLSLGWGTSDDDIDYALEVLLPIANRLLEMSPFFNE
jgi:cysteine desulfurase